MTGLLDRAREIQGLPTPVAGYFRRALRDGRPMVGRAQVSWRGDFLLRPDPRGWRSFTARQELAARPPGFVWDARIRMAPGLRIHVRDAFVDSAGQMVASLAGLVPLVSVRGTPEISLGALQRYLAEAVLLPTALLPSLGVAWAPLGDHEARATLSAGATTASLDFSFGADGLVGGVFSPARPREDHGRFVPTPWRGRWFDYRERDGMLVPRAGEVEWELPEGPQVYWKGTVTEIAWD